MSQQTDVHNHSKPPTHQQPSSRSDQPWLNHPAYLKWLRDFFRALFDFEFHESVTVRMLPLVYTIGIFASAVFALYAIVNAFLTSFWHGLGFLFVLGPLAFLFCITALRSTLEFFSAVFRIQQGMQQLLSTVKGLHSELARIHNDMEHVAEGVDNVAKQTSNITHSVNEVKAVLEAFSGITNRIPFFRKPKKINRQKQWAEAPLPQPFNVTDVQDGVAPPDSGTHFDQARQADPTHNTQQTHSNTPSNTTQSDAPSPQNTSERAVDQADTRSLDTIS
ncbi:MAG: DUF4282 domain-containing protein [Gammaproteobacteria bacterium]